MRPAVRYSWLMDLQKELDTIPSPLSSPPSITTNLQPNRFTSMLQRGPGSREEKGKQLGRKEVFCTCWIAAIIK